MLNDFNFLDLQVIRNMYKTKPVSYISMIIEKPEEIILEKVKEISLATGQLPFQDKKHNEALKKRTKKTNESVFNEVVKRSRSKNRDIRPKKEVKVFKNRSVDHLNLTPVRINAKTYIYIKAGEDPEKERKKWFDRHQPHEVVPENPWKKVSKFK